MPSRFGMTLQEILIVVAIIAVLAAMLIPAIGVVRNRAMVASTKATVSAISLALDQYRNEDMRRKLPPADGPTLQYESDESKPPTTLNLIELAGYRTAAGQMVATAGTRRVHIDAWKRPLRYQLDELVSGGAVKPAPLADWNPAGQQPFAYVWSLGRPRGSEADDAQPANAAGNWIYRMAGK